MLRFFVAILLIAFTTTVYSQLFQNTSFSGNFQTITQQYKEDSAIGAQKVNEQILSNSFLNVNFTSDKIDASIRYEAYLNALQGFPKEYNGQGIAYKSATYHNEKLSVTIGNFYEQYGNGFILRSYFEPNLGIDNSFEGINVKSKIYEGITISGMLAKQRLFWGKSEGIVRGVNSDIFLNEVFPSLAESKTKIKLGASFVSKYQADNLSSLYLPENVGAFSGRLNVTRGKISFSSEYAYKANDPSADNTFIYKSGQTIFGTLGYAQKGLGISVSAKHTDNMSFRSDRNESLNNALIGFQPAITKQHSYSLPASLYPYFSQLNGENALQADVIYKIKKNTLLGGKYGTQLLFNSSFVYGLDSTRKPPPDSILQGYTTKIFSVGEQYFQDINIEIRKKISKKVKLNLFYQYALFNNDVLKLSLNKGLFITNTVIADLSYKINPKNVIRAEVQHLSTKQDNKNWSSVLLEYTFSPHWFFSVFDQYNYGNPDESKRVHYLSAAAGYVNKGTRFSMSFGKQRAGVFCVGGVCRNIPASNGLTITLTSSF